MKLINASGNPLELEDLGFTLDTDEEINTQALRSDDLFRSSQVGGDIYTNLGALDLTAEGADGQPLSATEAQNALSSGQTSPISMLDLGNNNFVPAFYDSLRNKTLSVHTDEYFWACEEKGSTIPFYPCTAGRHASSLKLYHFPRNCTVVQFEFNAIKIKGPVYFYIQRYQPTSQYQYIGVYSDTTEKNYGTLLLDQLNFDYNQDDWFRLYVYPYNGGYVAYTQFWLKVRLR